jgi:hypothetical protein
MPLWRLATTGGGLGIGSAPSKGEVVAVNCRLKDVKIDIFWPDSRDTRPAGLVRNVADIPTAGSRGRWPVGSSLRDEASNGCGLCDADWGSGSGKRCRKYRGDHRRRGSRGPVGPVMNVVTETVRTNRRGRRSAGPLACNEGLDDVSLGDAAGHSWTVG